MERRLAAILAADVVGYSRQIRADEEGTLLRLKALRADCIDPIIADHHGRVVKLMGDGMLAEFASVVDAVRAAADIQIAVAEQQADLPDDNRAAFRIGVNLGDVVIDGDDIYGDGVNVAARLEGLAESGGLCVSDSVFEQVRDRVDLIFEDFGVHDLKNIDRPVQVWRWIKDRAETGGEVEETITVSPDTELPAVAVLPFANMSADPEQEYFSDGLAEDIITALAHWRSFPVIARNSSFAYKNKTVDVIQVARALGAAYVLEGSVRKAGARLRITAQLIDGSNGHHVWAERYDRELDDIFEVQDDIVQRIAAIAAPEMARAELRRTSAKRPQDLDAWDLYLRGAALLHDRRGESNVEARALFQQAIAIRPDYADAYAGLAQSYNQDVVIGVAKDRVAHANLAMQAAQKAVELDDSLSLAHHELSTAYQLLERTEDALAEVRIALRLNPNDAHVVHAIGNKSDLAGEPGGIVHMEKAQKLNPEDVQLHTHLTYLARAYVNAGNYDAAVDRARQAIRRRPDYAGAHYILAIALGQLGRIDEARATLATCEACSPGLVEARRNWQPYVNPESNARLRQALREIEDPA